MLLFMQMQKEVARNSFPYKSYTLPFNIGFYVLLHLIDAVYLLQLK